MPILKHHKKTGYVQISNILAQTGNLSYEALGVLVNLLSRPDDWKVQKTMLRNKHCGEVMLSRIFKELQDTGYLKLVHIRENNKIANQVWVVSDEPMLSSENMEENLQNLGSRKPRQQETSAQGNQDLQINNITNTENTNKEKENIKEKIFDTHTNNHSVEPTKKVARKHQSYTDDFEQAWALYPERDGSNSKPAAFKFWQARIAEGVSPDDLLLATKNYQLYCAHAGNTATSYVMQAQRFYGSQKEYERFINYKPKEVTSERDSKKSKLDRANAQFEAIKAAINESV